MATVQKYLDTRRQKADETFPIKIRIGEGKKAKLYSTKFSATETDFEKILKGGGNKTALKEIASHLDVLFDKAKHLVNEIFPFSYEKFETRFYQKGNRLDLIFLLRKKSEILYKENKINNSNLYKQAAGLLSKYCQERLRTDVLLLNDVTPQFLTDLEVWTNKIFRTDKRGEKQQKYSITTLGMYLIRVRAIFNDSISEGIISANSYPFHTPQNNKGYKIPKALNNKRALTKDQISQIFKYEAKNEGEQFAKDIFIFSYLASGMNCIDIFKLKWTDFEKDSFSFVRKKTAAKTGGRNIITIDLNPVMREIIEKHSTKKGESEYVFKVFSPFANEVELQRASRITISKINANLKKIAKKLEIDEEISTYFARHSFSTNLMNSEAPIALISKQLGHTSLKTTENYLSEFSSEKKSEYMKNLLDF